MSASPPPTHAPIEGHVFAYGSLANPADPLVARLGSTARAVLGHVEGYRRSWRAGMDNRAARNDHRHYVDRAGHRPDLVVVTLDARPAPGRINGVAIPVTADELALLDRREQRYERVDVRESFSVPLEGGPVWLYTRIPLAASNYEAARRRGRAFIRRSYHDNVLQTYRNQGEAAWNDFLASTDPPTVPLRDLRLVEAA
jgi:cation transport regulator ChaC